jgi:hypothetical protein
VQLARRGRLPAAVLATVALLALGAALWLGGAGSAQAAGRARPYQGLTRIVVRPGQTLGGIATAAEPTADIFGVIQQIVTVNRLPGTTIEAGEVLWVPK